MAVIASEDNRFAEHNGFDLVEIKKAMKEKRNTQTETGSKHHQSADSQECVLIRNLRGYAKGSKSTLRFHRTLLVERANHGSLSQLYRNGKWHLRRTSNRKKISSEQQPTSLTRGQCALIAATLPNPIRFNSAKPSSYILKRQSQILRLMNLVPKFPPEEKYC